MSLTEESIYVGKAKGEINNLGNNIGLKKRSYILAKILLGLVIVNYTNRYNF